MLRATRNVRCRYRSLWARDEQIPDVIERALHAGVRVDATLQELFPGLPRAASKGVP